MTSPASVLGVDPSPGQVEEARHQVVDSRARFETGTAETLPADSFDLVVSGLVLNFVPDPVAAVAAMARALGGGRHGRGVRLGLRRGDAAAPHVLGHGRRP